MFGYVLDEVLIVATIPIALISLILAITILFQAAQRGGDDE